MLNLDELPRIPPYELQYEGKKQTYDPLALFRDLEGLQGERDLVTIAQHVSKAFGIAVDTQQALAILADFMQHMEKHGEILKNVLGRWQSLVIGTESALEKPSGSENNEPTSISA